MTTSTYLVDTNVLLRWIEPSDPDYSLVSSTVQDLFRRRTTLYYTSQNLAEFWNACTRPADRNGFGLSPQETDKRARSIEARLRMRSDGLAVHDQWRKLIVPHGVSGAKVYDARLVAAMHVHGVRHVLTFNQRDFARYPDIEAIHPSQVATRNQ